MMPPPWANCVRRPCKRRRTPQCRCRQRTSQRVSAWYRGLISGSGGSGGGGSIGDDPACDSTRRVGRGEDAAPRWCHPPLPVVYRRIRRKTCVVSGARQAEGRAQGVRASARLRVTKPAPRSQQRHDQERTREEGTGPHRACACHHPGRRRPRATLWPWPVPRAIRPSGTPSALYGGRDSRQPRGE
jgi:hypothetical protein